MRRYSPALALPLAGAMLVAGCAYEPGPPGLLVDTTPPGAACVVSRLGQPIAELAPTPAIAMVDPNPNPITVACRRPGYADAAVTLGAQSTPPGYATGYAPAYPDRVAIALIPVR